MIPILWYLMAVGLRPAFLLTNLTMWFFVSGSRQHVDEETRDLPLELQSAQELDMAR